MNDLLWLLRWLHRPGARRSIGDVSHRDYMANLLPDERWHASAHAFNKTGSVDLTLHVHGYGRTPLRALRNLSRHIQETEAGK